MASYKVLGSVPDTEHKEGGRIVGSDSSETSLFDQKEVLDTELTAKVFDCKKFGDDQPVVERKFDLVKDSVVFDDKEADFDMPDEFTSYLSKRVGSQGPCVDKGEPLAGMRIPEDVHGTITWNNLKGDGVCSTENFCLRNGEIFCLGNAGLRQEDVVGSSAENIGILVTSPSPSTRPGERIQNKNHGDTENALDLLEAVRSCEIGEEKQDMLDGEKADLIIQTQHREESSCISVRQLPNVSSDRTIELSTSTPFFQVSSAVDNRARIQLVRNHQERYGCNGDQNCSNVADSSGPPETQTKEKDNINIDLVSVSIASDAILSPVRRSTRRNKFCQKDDIRKTSASGKKAVNKKLLQGENFLNAARRKRSCPCKPASSSIWGSSLNIIKVKDNEVTQMDGNRSFQVGNQRSHKRAVGLGNGRQKNGHTSSSSVPTDKCSNNHSTRIRLKVTVGAQNGKRGLSEVQSELLKSPASYPSVGGKCAIKPNNTICEISEAENQIRPMLEDGLSDGKQFTYADKVLENPVSSTAAHFLDSLHIEKDMESTVTQDTSVGNNFSYCPGLHPQVGIEGEEATGKQYLDPATSPDSEVISLTQNVSLGSDVLTTSQAVGSTDGAGSNMGPISLRKQMNFCQVKIATDSLGTSLAAEEKSLGQKKEKKFAKHRQEEKHVYDPLDTFTLGSNVNDSRCSSNAERHTNESLELSNLGESLKLETINKSCQMSEQCSGAKSAELLVPQVFFDTDKAMDLKPSSESSVEVRKQRSATSVSSKNRRNTSQEQRKSTRKSVNKKKVKEKDFRSKNVHDEKGHLETVGGINISSGKAMQLQPQKLAELIKGESMGFEIPSDPVTSIGNSFTSDESPVLPSDLNEQVLPKPDAWVRCDDCFKWRYIPTELANHIDATDCRWICSYNEDKAFADCSIPQEKSNEAINAELEISEFSGDEDASDAHPVAKGSEGKQLTVPKQAPWKLIQSNLFLHRTRKTQSIDEIMTCHCKRPPNVGLGCGDACLNRILNIECDRKTCPCGDRCSNQQFQQRKYAKLEHVRCGKKGYGLRLLESVSEGDFLIEYVGEVLDLNAYEARQREYAARGQRHFYFMTLNGSEVIDACAKGNLGRFINHSCDPNCCTEKWMVKGEVCIGLFAIRDIKEGEELTFDYNYVRVFGAAVKKCVCGSPACRGYIGGDPLNTDAVVLDDSDEEFPEPVMVNGDGEAEKNTDRAKLNTMLSDSEQLQNTDQIVVSVSPIKLLESPMEKYGTTSGTGDAVQSIEILPPNEESVNISLSSGQPPGMFTQTEVTVNKSFASSTSTYTGRKTSFDHVTANEKSLSDTVRDGANISKSHSLAKSSRGPSSIKKGKCNPNPVIASKHQVLENKAKKVLGGVANSHSKGVEEKLNELLDKDGGISKRKDATKGYLKLLVLTASSGDNVNGEAVQSTRELSIILDALLKTKKLNVLNDIINKNGLQMLHNLMKQNRKSFNRIPIIRKLLKILEYLAEKNILSLELINSPPPCDGMESFRESIFQLANHTDTKVHRIARDFRDKWMPRSFRRNNYADGNSVNMEQQAGQHCTRFPKYKQWCDHGSRPMANFDYSRQTTPRAVLPYVNIQKDCSGPLVNSYPGNGTKTRKRKSRWDQPEKGDSGPQPLELGNDQKARLIPSPQEPMIGEAVQEQVGEVNDDIPCHGRDHSISKSSESAASVDVVMPVLDDAPPGFPSLLHVPVGTLSTATSNLPPNDHHRSCSCEVVTGSLQERFDSNLSVSYGVPLYFVEQLGTPQTGSVDSWEISPGIPFHPFPPLPPYPRESNTRPPRALMRLENGESQRVGHRPSHHADAGLPCTSGTLPSEISNSGDYHRQMNERMGGPSGNIGRRFFRQQKWNNTRRPPYFRDRRNGWGFKGDNLRSRGSLGNVENQIQNDRHSEDGGGGGGNNNSSSSSGNSAFSQDPQQQQHYNDPITDTQ